MNARQTSKPDYAYVIYTDLDGTLLDHRTYRWTPASRALRRLGEQGVPLIVVSSKTRAEILHLLGKLNRREPFIVENGGAVYVPAGYFHFPVRGASPAEGGWRRVELGTSYRKLVQHLQESARQAGVSIIGFSQMSVAEVARATGLPPTQAKRAMQREYDEPFLIRENDKRAPRRLAAEIRRRGLQATRGGRFFHIMGNNDKGAAVRRLTSCFRRRYGPRLCTVGLGDSPNDIPLLRAVDIPILVARPNGRYDPESLVAVPNLRRAGGAGPVGWNRAVLKLLAGPEKTQGGFAP